MCMRPPTPHPPARRGIRQAPVTGAMGTNMGAYRNNTPHHCKHPLVSHTLTSFTFTVFGRCLYPVQMIFNLIFYMFEQLRG